MPLSVIREGRKPTAKWLPSDRLLSLALTLHEKSILGCGHYIDETGERKAEEFICESCAAVEKHQAAHEKPTPGAKVFAVPITTSNPEPGEVLPTYVATR